MNICCDKDRGGGISFPAPDGDMSAVGEEDIEEDVPRLKGQVSRSEEIVSSVEADFSSISKLPGFENCCWRASKALTPFFFCLFTSALKGVDSSWLEGELEFVEGELVPPPVPMSLFTELAEERLDEAKFDDLMMEILRFAGFYVGELS